MRDTQNIVEAGAQPAPAIAGHYRILERLGEGGMGTVYRAEHVHIAKTVALKILHADAMSNPGAVDRFRQEARSASSIDHPNIITIDDFGVSNGQAYMTMELLQGVALRDLLADRSLSRARALDILIQVATGLGAAHGKGIVHRDLKPENVFVCKDDRVKVLDFGIAKIIDGDPERKLTAAGAICGTPAYMAPEQIHSGSAVDHRADIYALGVIAYEVFCGQVPFQGDSWVGIVAQHVRDTPVPPSQMAARHGRVVPAGIAAIITKALEKDPAKRFATMADVIAALTEQARGVVGSGIRNHPQRRRPWLAVVVGLAIAAAAAAMVGLGSHGSDTRPLANARAPGSPVEPRADAAIPDPSDAGLAPARPPTTREGAGRRALVFVSVRVSDADDLRALVLKALGQHPELELDAGARADLPGYVIAVSRSVLERPAGARVELSCDVTAVVSRGSVPVARIPANATIDLPRSPSAADRASARADCEVAAVGLAFDDRLVRLLVSDAAHELVMAKLRSSYFDSLAGCLGTRRELALQLDVTAEGTVGGIRRVPDAGPRDPLVECITREARSWKFDALPGRKAITLSLRLGAP